MPLTPLLVMLVTQAVVVAASLAVPVLAPDVAGASGVSLSTVGYYTTLVFAGALSAAQIVPFLVSRLGPVGISQAAAVLAAIGLALGATGAVVPLALGAFAIGLAYAPGNPASSALLNATTPAGFRGRVFSIKQISMPLGGAFAGLAAPAVALVAGWQTACLALAAACLAAALGVGPWRQGLDQSAGLPKASISERGPGNPVAQVLSHPRLRLLGLVAGCLGSVQFATSAIFVAYLVERGGYTLATAGTALSVAMAGSIALRILLGRSADRIGGLPVLRAVSATMVVGALLSAGLLGLGGEAVPALPALVLMLILAAGAFSWNGVYLAEVAAAAPEGGVAQATSGTMSFVFLGGMVGPSAFAAMIDTSGSYGAGFAVMALLAAGAFAALTLIPARD